MYYFIMAGIKFNIKAYIDLIELTFCKRVLSNN